MTIYIQLLTLTPEGREKALQDPENILRVQENLTVPGIQVLGLYAVLGAWDFVNIVEAPDNEVVARFSLQLGVRAGVHITTLPAIPIGRMEATTGEMSPQLEAEIGLTPPD